MATVFVSFDWDHDRRYKFLLAAWDKNPRFQFVFDDATSREINSTNVGRVKAALTAKINAANYTLVIVGQYANSLHADRALIGYTNWINFEIARSKAAENRIVAVKLNREHTSPSELLGAGASWAMAFDEQPILKALAEA